LSNAEQEPQRVTPDDWLRQGLSGDASAKELHPLQRVGYKLALFVFGYIVVATVAILFISFKGIQLPSFPQPPTASGNADGYKGALEAYKQSSDVYQSLAKMQVDRALQLFQLIVASTILPAFTAILGYIFGSRKND
jgi:hypothetical protein